MIRSEALTVLNLPETVGPEAIAQAYRRLVRRYPPEFHPEKFRQIDAAYTFLTSLSHRLERLLSPQKFQSSSSAGDFPYKLSPPALSPEDLLAAFHKQLLFSHLWELNPETADKRRNPSKPPSSEDPD
jgi:curved DNA-binding protein CbpA